MDLTSQQGLPTPSLDLELPTEPCRHTKTFGVSVCMPLKTILVVDDEETDREQIRDILHTQDYMVLEAGAYDDALRVFERNRDAVDLLISDISLPSENGCNLAITLREQKADLRVLFISGYV